MDAGRRPQLPSLGPVATRRFERVGGFLNGADHALFVDGRCVGLVWKDGTSLGWWPWTIAEAEGHVRDGLWRELCDETHPTSSSG
jgi:hypothetical protein